MAQKITVIEELIDDIDGTEADETISFGFNGTNYEIDLNKAHADDLKEQMKFYMKVAREVGRSSKGGGKKSAPKASKPQPTVVNPAGVSEASIRAQRSQNREIREWARAKGFECPSHGRIPQEVREAYNREFGVQTGERSYS